MYNDLQILIQIASSDDVTWESARRSLLRVFDGPRTFGILTYDEHFTFQTNNISSICHELQFLPNKQTSVASFSNQVTLIFIPKIIIFAWERVSRWAGNSLIVSLAIDEGNSARNLAASYYEGSSLSYETRKRRKIKTSSLLRATPETIIDCY